MTSVEELVAKLGLDVSEFKEGMVKSGEAVQGLNEKMESFQKGLAGAAVGEFVHKILEGAAATVHFADNIGVSTTAMQALTFAAAEHSVKAEDVQKVWTTVRRSLDELRAGNEATAHTFARLGLSVEDFENLSLDEALQKITHAFAENEDHAGAYDALQQLVGKSGRNLTSTLKELGEQGFGTLIESAKHAHAIIEDSTLRDLERTNKQWEEMGNVFKTGGAFIVGAINNIMTAVGTLAGALVELGSAMLKGGPFTSAGREQMKATWEALKDINQQLEEKHSGMADSAHKTAEAHKEMLPPLAEAKELVEARQKYEEAIAKLSLEGLSTADKMASLEAQIAQHTDAAMAARKNSVEYYKQLTEVAKFTAEYAKLEHEQIEKSATEQLKRLELQRQELPVTQQRAIMLRELSIAEAAVTASKAQGIDTSKAQETLDKTRHDLKQLDLKLAEEDVKAAADLLSTDVQVVETAKVKHQLIAGELTQQQVLGEMQTLLARGVDNLTEKEKIRLNALVANLAILQKEAEIKAILSKGVENLTDEDRKRLGVLTSQVDALKQQKVEVDDIITAWTDFTATISRTGSPYASQSTVALEGLLGRLKSQLNPLGDLPGASYSGVSYAQNTNYGAYLNNAALNPEIKAIEDELNRRSQVAGYLNQYGESAARGKFGDDATNKAMQDLSATSKATAADIRDIADRLSGRSQIFGG